MRDWCAFHVQIFCPSIGLSWPEIFHIQPKFGLKPAQYERYPFRQPTWGWLRLIRCDLNLDLKTGRCPPRSRSRVRLTAFTLVPRKADSLNFPWFLSKSPQRYADLSRIGRRRRLGREFRIPKLPIVAFLSRNLVSLSLRRNEISESLSHHPVSLS